MPSGLARRLAGDARGRDRRLRGPAAIGGFRRRSTSTTRRRRRERRRQRRRSPALRSEASAARGFSWSSFSLFSAPTPVRGRAVSGVRASPGTHAETRPRERFPRISANSPSSLRSYRKRRCGAAASGAWMEKREAVIKAASPSVFVWARWTPFSRRPTSSPSTAEERRDAACISGCRRRSRRQAGPATRTRRRTRARRRGLVEALERRRHLAGAVLLRISSVA